MTSASGRCSGDENTLPSNTGMSINFEELDYRQTRLGPLSLRRRRMLSLDGLEVFEVKLGEKFLMSSLFTTAEIELARLGLAGQ